MDYENTDSMQFESLRNKKEDFLNKREEKVKRIPEEIGNPKIVLVNEFLELK